jgi:hypothetical protein
LSNKCQGKQLEVQEVVMDYLEQFIREGSFDAKNSSSLYWPRYNFDSEEMMVFGIDKEKGKGWTKEFGHVKFETEFSVVGVLFFFFY